MMKDIIRRFSLLIALLSGVVITLLTLFSPRTIGTWGGYSASSPDSGGLVLAYGFPFEPVPHVRADGGSAPVDTAFIAISAGQVHWLSLAFDVVFWGLIIWIVLWIIYAIRMEK